MESKQEITAPSQKELIQAIATTKDNLHKYHHDITGIVWPAQVMKVILGLKAEKRGRNQLPFHYQVIEYEEDDSGKMAEKNEDLLKIVQFLETNADKLPPGLRFQLAVLLDGHWTAVDHVVTSKGISCFNLDAVMDKRALRFFRNYISLLDRAKVLHASYMYYVSVPQSPFERTPKEKVENMIQTDLVSCGIFMADHLSFLSRTNVFHHLKVMAGEPVFKTLGRNDISPPLAPIFRLTQSRHLLKKLSGAHVRTPISKDNSKTLKDVQQQSLTESIKYNVIAKGDKLLDQAVVDLKSMESSDIAALFAGDLMSRLAAYVNHHSPVVNQLVGLIYTRITECKAINDETVMQIMAAIHQIILAKDSDLSKLNAINDLLLTRLPRNDVNTSRLMAASICFTAFQVQDNHALWQFYAAMMQHPGNTGLNHHTNSFFSTPTKLTPALSTHIEKAVKVQLLINAVDALHQGHDSPLDTLSDKMQQFIKKSRTFEVKTTKSESLLQQILLAGSDKSRLQAIALELETNKAAILLEFGFERESPSSEQSLNQ
ncbi:hypothetical protein DIZ81_04885 [Legionella taurinensis]|uniref:Type IV secretion protein Dot n=1 Tax=Legionella taurinensis TaxID=70611 RepID=A0AB38N8I7_9GAMM|nr:hypothetical protein [Legionella taurinensis]MDX1837007.1 hypothetical protein [Legionella taurinensis]PUT41413.1 hypothetical protein DB744_04885 [Legionella taurinensis]PUT42652.1 hypothetical protein DB746_07220 [Legionella taurinensis]PUT46680.1 hypothetical protein DB743_04620 [Legionella taurinensis]PUT47329.1 hypothetical protein DB745_08300 [Legionella taurinensis]